MMNWICIWRPSRRDLAMPQLLDQMLRICFFGSLKPDAAEDNGLTASTPLVGEDSFSLWQNIPKLRLQMRGYPEPSGLTTTDALPSWKRAIVLRTATAIHEFVIINP